MLWWLAENAVLTTLLAGLVILLCRFGRFRPAVRHALWLLVLLKFLSPPLLPWPWEMTPAPELAPMADRAPVSPPEEYQLQPLPEPEGIAPDLMMVPEPATGAAEEPMFQPSETAPATVEPMCDPETPWQVPLASVALGVWLAGAALLGMWRAVHLLRFARRVARSQTAPAWLVAEVRELAERLGVRPPSVWVLSGLVSPVVWGLGRPRILWPTALLESLSDESRRTATLHELAHLRRRDHWVSWLQLVAGPLWWWHPLFWYVCRQLNRTAELACDAWVVQTLPGLRRPYAEALLEVCALMCREAVLVPAVGMGGSRVELERRLTMIMRDKVPCRLPLRGLLGIGLLALIVLPGWTLGQRPAETEKPTLPPTATPAPAPDRAIYTVAVPVEARKREQRLQKVEAALAELLKEVQQLRTEGPKPPTGNWVSPPPAPPYAVVPTPAAYPPGNPVPSGTPLPEAPVVLTRGTYKLPKEKAGALAKFLREQVKSPVMEIKEESTGLVVTTTPDAQHALQQFVELLQGQSSSAIKYYYQPVTSYQAVPYGYPVPAAVPPAPGPTPKKP